MRLLIITAEFPPFLGGVATYTYNLVLNLSKKGIEVHVICPTYSIRENKNFHIYPILESYKAGTNKFLNLLKNALKLRKYYNQIKPDKILITNYYAQRIISIYNLFFKKIKYSISLHGTELFFLFPDKKNIKMLIKALWGYWIFNYANYLFPVSSYTENSLKKRYSFWFNNISSLNIEVIYNSISLDFCKEFKDNEKESLKNRLGVKEGDLVLLSIGRLVKGKGFDLTIKAINGLSYGRIKYIIIGDGEEKSNLLNLTKDNCNIILTGGIEDRDLIKLYLSISDIFIMPSRHILPAVESFAIVLLEASLYKLPLIGSNVGGIPEIIINNYNGLLFGDGNIDQLKNHIMFLVRSESTRKEMGFNAYERVKNKFITDLQIDRLLEKLSA